MIQIQRGRLLLTGAEHFVIQPIFPDKAWII
jgi:hypothetical protein